MELIRIQAYVTTLSNILTAQIQKISKMNELSGHHIATQQEKLDAIFGITGGKSVDEFLDGLSLENDDVKNAVLSIDQELKEQVEKLDSYQVSIQTGQTTDVMLDIASMSHSLKEVEELI